MPNRHDFVTNAVDDVDGSFNLLAPIDVGEGVAPDGEPEVLSMYCQSAFFVQQLDLFNDFSLYHFALMHRASV
jgi:hypothetical protein